jgi:multiple sugar transport system substrate-binding protein
MTDNYWTRRISRRRLFHGAGALAGASAFGALVAACGGSKSSSSNTSSSSASPASKANPVDSVDLTGKKINLTFWHAKAAGPKQDTLNAIVDQFNKSQNIITVQPQFQGNYNDLYKKLLVSVSGGVLPDLADAYPSQVSEYQSAKAVVVLEDYINSSKYGLSKSEQDDYIKAYWNENTYPEFNNQHLSFPFSKSFLVTYYNADKLKALNLAKTPDQWTWDDFVAAAKAGTSGTNKGWVIDIDPSTFDGMIYTRGGKLISDDQKQWQLNQQPGVDSLSLHSQAAREGWGYQWTAPGSLIGDFGTGRVLLKLGTSSDLANQTKQIAGDGKFNWNIAMIPHNSGVSPVTVLYGGSVAVFKSNPDQQLAAWQFIKYLTSPTVTAQWAVGTGYTPIRQSAVQSDAVQQAVKASPQLGVLLNQIVQYGKPETTVKGTQDTRNYISDAMTQAILQPNSNAKQLLDTVVQKGNQALAQG